MGIRVTYNPVAAAGMGALHAGYGQYNARQEDLQQRWNMMLAQQQAQREADAARMQHAAEQAHYQRIFQADRDQFLAKNQADRDQWQFGAQAERDEFLAGNQAERDKFRADNEFEMLQKKYDFDKMEYSDKQKRYLAAVDSDIFDVMTSDDWTPEKKAEIINDLKLKKYGLPPMKHKEPPPQSMTDEYIEKNYRELGNGYAVITTPDGKTHIMQPTGGQRSERPISFKELNELREDAREKLTQYRDEQQRDPNDPSQFRSVRVPVEPTDEQIDEYIGRVLEQHQRFTGRQMQPGKPRARANPAYMEDGGTPLGDLPFNRGGGKINLPVAIDPNSDPNAPLEVELLASRGAPMKEILKSQGVRALPAEVQSAARQQLALIINEMVQAQKRGDTARIEELRQAVTKLKAEIVKAAAPAPQPVRAGAGEQDWVPVAGG